MSHLVAIVGVKDCPGILGKMTPRYFLPPFEKKLDTLGIEYRHYTYSEFKRRRERHDAALFVYDEDHWDQRTRDLIGEAHRIAMWNNTPAIHSPIIGRILADKKLTNEVLSNAGVSMPKVVSAKVAPTRVFSNANMATHVPTAVIHAGCGLDPTRYNTEWIDTRHDHRGRRYYVALRALAVGRRCVSTYVRARPEEQGDASVHASDTPRDAQMWNSLYERIVLPNRKTIESMCDQIADALGLGFYAHDLLPDCTTGHLLLCETGFKFDDQDFRNQFDSLRGSLVSEDFLSAELPAKSAYYFAAELESLWRNDPESVQAGNDQHAP